MAKAKVIWYPFDQSHVANFVISQPDQHFEHLGQTNPLPQFTDLENNKRVKKFCTLRFNGFEIPSANSMQNFLKLGAHNNT